MRTAIPMIRWMILIIFSVLNVVGVGIQNTIAQDDQSTTIVASPLLHVGRVIHPPLNEMSGIVKSNLFDDVWWVHNDSGDQPRIFAINAEGAVIMPGWQTNEYFANEFVAGKQPYPGIEIKLATHMDWEDIAIKDGLLYVGDFGNNYNSRRDLGIYVIAEPNPHEYPWTRPIKFIPIAYPDQQAFAAETFRFDCESMFFIDGILHLMTKHRVDQSMSPESGTKLYRLDNEDGDRVNMLTLVDEHARIGRWPTAADMSPDGNRLAVLTENEVWVFERPAHGDRWLSDGAASRVKLPPKQAKQAEAICWDDAQTLRITNEQRDVFTLSIDAFEPVND